MTNSLYGYDSLVDDLKRIVDSGNISHAYLFYGEQEIGKFLCAQSFANYISNKSFEIEKGISSDTYVVDFSSDSSTLSDSLEKNKESLGIDKIRELEHFLYQTPISSHYRIAIIRDAQWLTNQAQNALLKILEEPPKSGIILATTLDPNLLVPAVKSRFQLIFMPILSDEKVFDFINRYDIKDSEKKSILEKAFGRIGRAERASLEYIDDTDINKKSFAAIQKKASQLSKKAPQLSSDFSRKKLSDEIIDFFDENPQNADIFIEELMCVLRGDKKNANALKLVCEFANNLKSYTLQKRIHIKKVLWEIH